MYQLSRDIREMCKVTRNIEIINCSVTIWELFIDMNTPHIIMFIQSVLRVNYSWEILRKLGDLMSGCDLGESRFLHISHFQRQAARRYEHSFSAIRLIQLLLVAVETQENTKPPSRIVVLTFSPAPRASVCRLVRQIYVYIFVDEAERSLDPDVITECIRIIRRNGFGGGHTIPLPASAVEYYRQVNGIRNYCHQSSKRNFEGYERHRRHSLSDTRSLRFSPLFPCPSLDHFPLDGRLKHFV